MIKGLQVINKVIIIRNEDINPDPIVKDDELVIMSLKESEFDKYLAIFENEKRYISDQFAFLNDYLHEDYLNDRLSLTFAIKTIENEDIIGAIKVLKGEDEVDYSKYSYNLKVYIKPENRNKGYASETLIALFRAIKTN